MISWRRELRGARRRGRRDGRAGVPGADDVSLPFDLREILARGQEQTERMVARSRDRDQQLGAELDDLTHRAVDAEARLTEAEQQRDAAQGDHERRTADDDERLGRLQTQLEELPAGEDLRRSSPMSPRGRRPSRSSHRSVAVPRPKRSGASPGGRSSVTHRLDPPTPPGMESGRSCTGR